jgi:hypothetical protein
VNALVQAAFEIDETVAWPEAPLEFFSRAYLSRALQQEPQDFGGLRPQPDFEALLSQFSSLWIEFKNSKAQTGPGRGRSSHGAQFVFVGLERENEAVAGNLSPRVSLQPKK